MAFKRFLRESRNIGFVIRDCHTITLSEYGNVSKLLSKLKYNLTEYDNIFLLKDEDKVLSVIVTTEAKQDIFDQKYISDHRDYYPHEIVAIGTDVSNQRLGYGTMLLTETLKTIPEGVYSVLKDPSIQKLLEQQGFYQKHGIQFKNGTLLEWKYREGYAGRAIVKGNLTKDVIVWTDIFVPVKKGLLYTYPDGRTFLENRKIGDVDVLEVNRTTHKQMLAQMYKNLGFDRMPGNLRDNVEMWYLRNVRGRIVKDEIFVYDYDDMGVSTSQYNKLVQEAYRKIARFIPEYWWIESV